MRVTRKAWWRWSSTGCVDDVLAHKASPAELEKIRVLLTSWRDNDVNLRPQIEASFLLREAAPLSQNLSALGAAGLTALDYFEHGARPAPDWANQQLSLIETIKRPQAELLLAVAPAVEKLVRATQETQ